MPTGRVQTFELRRQARIEAPGSLRPQQRHTGDLEIAVENRRKDDDGSDAKQKCALKSPSETGPVLSNQPPHNKGKHQERVGPRPGGKCKRKSGCDHVNAATGKTDQPPKGQALKKDAEAFGKFFSFENNQHPENRQQVARQKTHRPIPGSRRRLGH